MDEGARKELYWSLLRGIARECQDRLCAADTQHDWSNWHRTALQHDIPLAGVGDTSMMDMTYRVRSDRRCLNCGKTETA